jgi:hypothetical protein
MIRHPKKPRDIRGAHKHKTRDTYPEVRITEDDQSCTMEKVGGMFHRTPHRITTAPTVLQTAVCTDQQSGQWLIRATDNSRMKSGVRRRASDAKHLPKPAKVTLRAWEKFAQSQEELLK